MSSNQPSADNISDRKESSTPTIAAMLRSNVLCSEGHECMIDGKSKDALEKFNQAIALFPDPFFFCKRAGAYITILQYNDAINDCRTAIKLDPKCAFAYFHLGFVYYCQARYNDAKEAYKKAVELDPENEDYKGDLASLEEKLKAVKQESSQPTFEVIEKANAVKEEGNEYMKASKFKEALEKYTQAIALKRDPVYLCNRSAAHCGLKQYNDALNDSAEALLLDSNYAKAYARLGFIFSCKGFYILSERNYKTALDFDPTNENYKKNLALAETKVREAGHGP